MHETGQSVVPVTVAVNGTVLHGSLIAEERYFAELAEVNPLMNALNPRAGLLGNDYEKNVKSESGQYLHLRAARLALRGRAGRTLAYPGRGDRRLDLPRLRRTGRPGRKSPFRGHVCR